MAIGRWLSNSACEIILQVVKLTFDLFCRREAPIQDLASSFFSGSRGTIISGAAHFTSASGPQVAVHIHRTFRRLEYNLHLMRIKSVEPSASFMNTSELLNPIVRTEESQTFQGLD
jgi:hypothetical protein